MGSGSGVRQCGYQGLGEGYTGWVPGGGVLPTQPDYIGIARAQRMAGNPVIGHAEALQGLPGPSAHLSSPALRYALLDPIRRDSGLYILKLVIIPECRLKSVMRPAILPVPKNRL